MLNSGKKIRALCDKKNIYSNSCVVRKKYSERNKKPYTPPPLQVKWSVPKPWTATIIQLFFSEWELTYLMYTYDM